jgi:hypothetical protein
MKNFFRTHSANQATLKMGPIYVAWIALASIISAELSAQDSPLKILTPIEVESSLPSSKSENGGNCEKTEITRPDTSPQSLNPVELEQYAETIHQIRRQLNNGSVSKLAEILGDKEVAERHFDDELKRLVTQQWSRDDSENQVREPHVDSPAPQEHSGRARTGNGGPLRPLPAKNLPHPNHSSLPQDSPGNASAAAENQRFNLMMAQPTAHWEAIPHQPRDPEQRVRSGFQAPAPTHLFASPIPPGSQQHHLRSTAKRLEGVAAELEDLQLYEEADQIRQLATSIWKKAREGNNQDGPKYHTYPHH